MKSRDDEIGNGAGARSARAVELLAEFFRRRAWDIQVETKRHGKGEDPVPVMVIRKGAIGYAVDVKVAADGRADRIVPLWAQACLQISRIAAARGLTPLAVVAAPEIRPRVAQQVIDFARKFAPDAALGVVDFAGLRRFSGPGIEYSHDPDERPSRRSIVRDEFGSLFSDLNQWMLKVLLAPEIPAQLLNAPRDRYKNASELARAANVSVMSAFRFVQQLEHDGHLDESVRHLRLVRREELFQSWAAWALVRRAKEMPVRFLLRGKIEAGVAKMLESGNTCLALFAAADALHVGFVSGVHPYLYLLRRGRLNLPSEWRNVVHATPHERPDVILREPPALQSVIRGLVDRDHQPSSDIIQVWLDVASHPSRGREQADEIRRGALRRAIDGGVSE
jgi:hypothetical protein